MARVRAAAAAALLLLIVVAVPLALAGWGVSPGALGNLTRPDDGSALLAALTAIGWAAWLAFTGSVVLEGINLLGRRAVPLRVPLLGGLQSIAAALIFAAFSSVVIPAGAAQPQPAGGQGATGLGVDVTQVAAADTAAPGGAAPTPAAEPAMTGDGTGDSAEGHLVAARR